MTAKAKSERGYWSHSSKERGSWRWWLHRKSHGDDILSVSLSWKSDLKGIWLARSDEGRWHTAFAIGVLYASVAWRPTWAKYSGYGSGRELALSFHDWAIWWKVWVDPDSWQSSRPRWRDGNFHPIDALFGRQDCTLKVIEVRDVVVPMPEKSYPAKAQLIEFKWKRPRSPFSKTMLRVNLDIPGGIPHAGKGENSWDCGDDATFGLTTGECRTIPEGVGMLVGSCLRTRVRYGGWDDYSWKKEVN